MGLFTLHLLIFYFTFSNIISGSGYKHFKLQGYDLCTTKTFKAALDTVRVAFGGAPKITLGERSESGAIISQIWNSTSLKNIKINCNFRIEASKSNRPGGVYVVITKLKFRKDPETNSCIDYIEFSEGNGPPSRRICDDIGINDNGAITQLIFDKRENRVRVQVSINEIKPITEPLEIKLVVTAHSECQAADDFLCDPDDPYTCISKAFKGDGITNCMPPYSDEIGEPIDESFEPGNIAIIAVSSFVFTMVGVGFFIWICWKYCISVVAPRQEQQSSDHRHHSDVPTIELPQSPFEGTIISNPRPPSPKDLPPPSYESLFPES